MLRVSDHFPQRYTHQSPRVQVLIGVLDEAGFSKYCVYGNWGAKALLFGYLEAKLMGSE